MKRIYERILFMGIGAFIAFLAYSVGTIENGVNAQHPDLEEFIKCDTLHVSKRIWIGDPETGASIEISPSRIYLSGDGPLGEACISITTEDGAANISLFGGDITNLVNHYLMLISVNNVSKIIKKDKFGKKEY